MIETLINSGCKGEIVMDNRYDDMNGCKVFGIKQNFWFNNSDFRC